MKVRSFKTHVPRCFHNLIRRRVSRFHSMFHTSSYGLLRWIVLDSTVSVDESMDTSLDESMDKSMGISGFRVYLKVLDYVGFMLNLNSSNQTLQTSSLGASLVFQPSNRIELHVICNHLSSFSRHNNRPRHSSPMALSPARCGWPQRSALLSCGWCNPSAR